jgi:RNA polymerase sigma-70 factor (ECF subfamily)
MSPSTDTKSDEELARQAQAGSRRCFEELTERYSAKLFHFLKQKIASDQDIEDIVQETFYKLYRNILRFDPNYKFSTWLYTAANRLAISYFRSKQTQKTFPLISDPAAEIQDQSGNSVFHSTLWEKASDLKPLYYKALWLRYVENMPSKDMAKVLKKSDVAIRLILHRARLTLAKKLQTENSCTNTYSRAYSGASKLHITENQR